MNDFVLCIMKFSFWVLSESTQAFRIGIRQQPKTNTPHNMARSLPVSVPFPEGLPKRGEIFDIPSEEDEEEIFFEGPQGTLQNKLFEFIELIHYKTVQAPHL